jgi:hypothetical protein
LRFIKVTRQFGSLTHLNRDLIGVLPCFNPQFPRLYLYLQKSLCIRFNLLKRAAELVGHIKVSLLPGLIA